MINHGYTVKVCDDDVVNQNFNDIKLALDTVAKALQLPNIVTFVSLGANGVGDVVLVPPKMANGVTPLYRALAGFKLVAAINMSTLAVMQTSFEQVLTKNDSIRQIDSANLSGFTFIFLLQG